MQYKLFISLDKNGSFTSFFSWLVPILILYLINKKSGLTKSLEMLSVKNSLCYKFKLNSKVKMHSVLKLFKLIMVGMFLKILFLNLLGLAPYMFSMTSQMLFVIMVSFILWLSMFISSIMYLPMEFFSHLSPNSCPLWLVQLLKLIELMSNMIRPLTLTLRLSIKMTTGHILLSLVSSGLVLSMLKGYLMLSLLMMVFLMFYMCFEMFVSLMQSFVFGLLMNQYLKEHSM